MGAAACRWEALTKKIPAINASGKVKEKAEPRTRIASRLSLGSVDKKDARYKRGHKTSRKNLRCANCSPQVWEALTKKIPAKNASDKAKEKAEPRTRIASRLSLVEMRGVEPLSESHLPALSTSVAGILHLPQDSAYRQALAFGSP